MIALSNDYIEGLFVSTFFGNISAYPNHRHLISINSL